jgi:hypothetical protein
VTWQDLDKLHRELGAKRPFMANRLLSLASKAWALAQRWQWFLQDRSNPAARHDRFAEPHRGRDFTREELERIGAALTEQEDATAVAAFKLCLFMGARRERWSPRAGKTSTSKPVPGSSRRRRPARAL